MSLPQRTLGRHGPAVGALGLGCMGMSWAYAEQEQPAEASVALIQHAIDNGVTLIDTADIYGPFSNEELVGRAVRARRDLVTLATKGGLESSRGERVGDVTIRPNGHPEHLRSACEASLARLGVDHIDLYYLHRVDPAVPVEESWGALAALQHEGKVRWLGISEATPDQLRAAHAIHPITAVQSELSLWTRDPQLAVLPWCADNGVAFVPFAPLGRGFLTGRFTDGAPDDFRAGLPRFQADALAGNQRILDTITGIANRYDATPSQVALAWVLAQGTHVIPIPGTTKPRHLNENLAALRLSLDHHDLATLNDLPAPVGSRY